MNALRLEADESAAKVEELSAKVKTLEQENLAKEQEITSLSHKNQLLEQELEKLEAGLKDAKAAADDSAQHGSQNESLSRRLQVLEEEAEEYDKKLKETTEKYAVRILLTDESHADAHTASAKLTSRPGTTSARSRLSKPHATNGSQSTRRWPRSTPTQRRSWTTSSPRLATSERAILLLINPLSYSRIHLMYTRYDCLVTALSVGSHHGRLHGDDIARSIKNKTMQR